jgi:hypothetical protein
VGDKDGFMNFPTDVAVNATGDVFVADTNNHRIQKFTTSGPFHPVAVQNSTWGRLKTLYAVNLTKPSQRGR